MVVADRRARLDRIGGDAGVADLQRDDVLGTGERRVGRILVTHHQRERDVVGCFVPDDRRAGFHGILDIDHCRQRLVIDLDQFGGILSLRQRFGDDERDALADRAHLVGGENAARRAKALRAAHVLGHRRRQAAELVGIHIGAGQHREHAVGGLGLGGVDALDARVRVRRHHQDAVSTAAAGRYRRRSGRGR